ncbi:Eukaryotic translation initiation factor 3 subunit B [Hibiscus syriacus]|uniref:Eukaryotic translation initiation factor 3 subunit B n=1 Tax=Hibiscus syriacus TaxID=106335 RepID=A0A6A3AWN8_HIBSY|nr:Eukaryotic translation initiation factor 3 subunit B [Hibiscus syriacus]
MKEEIQALESIQLWSVVYLPKDKKPISCKWVFRLKYKASREVERFNARLVAKGYNQRECVDFVDTVMHKRECREEVRLEERDLGIIKEGLGIEEEELGIEAREGHMINLPDELELAEWIQEELEQSDSEGQYLQKKEMINRVVFDKLPTPNTKEPETLVSDVCPGTSETACHQHSQSWHAEQSHFGNPEIKLPSSASLSNPHTLELHDSQCQVISRQSQDSLVDPYRFKAAHTFPNPDADGAAAEDDDPYKFRLLLIGINLKDALVEIDKIIGKEEKYFAKLGKNMIYVYEIETFSLIDKKSFKVENVVDFNWSPIDLIIALFVPELGGGNQPARVNIVQIHGKEELRQKNIFSISDNKMYWQNNCEYLAVQADRYTKTKKSTYTGFELLRIKERDIPIEVLELDNKNDKIIAFPWEPNGPRFSVIYGDNPRPDISFYSMRSTHNLGCVAKLTTLKGKQTNSIFWSSGGRFIVFAGLKGFNGQLEFFNVDEIETMATVEHFMATDVEWDSTGRYVATLVTSVHEMENSFNIWSFNGKLLYRILKDHFFHFLWRLRPPSFLTPEKEEVITKNMKKYNKKYAAEDQDVSMILSEQDRVKRRMLKEEWEKWVSKWRWSHEEEQMERHNLRDGEASDEEEEITDDGGTRYKGDRSLRARVPQDDASTKNDNYGVEEMTFLKEDEIFQLKIPISVSRAKFEQQGDKFKIKQVDSRKKNKLKKVEERMLRWGGHDNTKVTVLVTIVIRNMFTPIEIRADADYNSRLLYGGNVMHKRECREEVRLEERDLGIIKEGLGIEEEELGIEAREGHMINLPDELEQAEWIQEELEQSESEGQYLQKKEIINRVVRIYTFSPVAKLATVRSVIAFATQFGWLLFQMDIYNAFLQSDLVEDVYMELPREFYSQGVLVMRSKERIIMSLRKYVMEFIEDTGL